MLAGFLLAGLVMGQSLSEIAKKEKERRKRNEKKAGEVHVITEDELQEVRRASPPSEESTAEASATSRPSPRSPTTPRPPRTPRQGGDEVSEGGAPTEIPRDADLREKIAVFEQMLAAHRAEVKEIDDEIAKNNARIEEIERELSTMGAGGLPVAPAVDQQVRNPAADTVRLRAEQNELRQKNQQLEAQKRRSAEELRQKGRRAGIPAGYLRF
jgi:hypothetical protein